MWYRNNVIYKLTMCSQTKEIFHCALSLHQFLPTAWIQFKKKTTTTERKKKTCKCVFWIKTLTTL